MEVALNSDTPGGFENENAAASQNGLALLASITLKNALNINNDNKYNNTIKNSNNINENMSNNRLTFNHNNSSNKNNIKHSHHQTPQQPPHGLISLSTIESSLSAASNRASLSTSTNTTTTIQSSSLQQQIEKQENFFNFSMAKQQGLSGTETTTTSTIKTEQGTAVVNNSQELSTTTTISTTLANVAALPSNNHNFQSTNIHQTKNSTTSSANDSSVALLEALSIKPNKKLQQHQQKTSTLATSSTATHSAVGNSGGNKNNFKIPSDILDDLASRFIINVPDMELSNLIRICFQIEQAHWFYLDFFCAAEEERKLQPCGIKQFALQLFEHIPILRPHLSSLDKILEDWKNYKLSVPTYGGILISEDLNFCLLVQSYFAKTSWGFPKGKINENEDPVHCATREVYEETGYDITELIVPNDYIEAVINYQYTRLYIVSDVSLDTKFLPRTRNEIRCCNWFPIDALPINKNDAISKPNLCINPNSFYMIMPFVKRLKKWVNDKRNGVDTRRKYSGTGGISPTSTSPLTMHGGQVKSNCKKQHKRNNSNNFNNDDTNALNNAAVSNGGCGDNNNGGAVAALSTSSCGNNVNVNCPNSNSCRSKRQRHKSMGDLDGIRFNNSNSFNNQSNNCKITNNNNCVSITTTTTAAISGGNNNNNNCNISNNNNQKRHSKIVAAGSNVSNNINNNTNNGCNGNNNVNNNNCGNNPPSKRQLFHSQSQTYNLQQNNEKIVSSFDLIRKEKQQMKAALAKAQKQQQNSNSNNGRQRAKSQSDKMSMQQQQQQKSHGKQQRLQKQQSLVVTNSNMQNYNVNNNNKNHNNTKLIVNSFNKNMTTTTTEGYKIPTPPPISGTSLLTLAVAAAAATSVVNTNATATATTTTTSAATVTPQPIVAKSASGIQNIPEQQQQKPRPLSVSLHFPEVSKTINKESSELMATGQQQQQQTSPQLQRMASGTNIRILKRSTSYQPTQQKQASAIQFTPGFSSWTNFTFTKNFINNSFC